MKKVIATMAIIVVLGGLVIFAYIRKGRQSGDAGGFRRGQMDVFVKIEPVASGDIASVIVPTGAVSARAEVEVYPKQTGELVSLLIDRGDRVKAGQILARIEPIIFEIEIKRAKADLASAEATYDKSSPLAAINSETDFKQAKSNLDRLKSVLRQAELDLELQEKQANVKIKKAEADLRIAQARLEAAVSGARDQELEQAKVKTENAKRDLERLLALYKDEMVSQDQVEAAQLQYDIYGSQFSLLAEGARPEDIKVSEAQVETAKASLESAEHDRMLIEIKRSSLNAAKAQVDDAEAGFAQATAAKDASVWEKDLAKAQAAVQRAQASLEMAQQRLADSIIEAPIGGIIAQRFLDKGDLATLARPFVTIVDMDVVKVLAKVSALDLVNIKLGDQAIIKPDAYPGRGFPGTVTNISPVIDRTNQTFEIEIEAANPDHELKPGMFTRAELTVAKEKDVPIIPVDVILKENDEIFVYVVNGGKAEKRTVIVGINNGVRAEILSGLEVGDEYVVAGYHNLRPGMSVKLVGSKPAASGKEVKQ